MSKIIVLSGWRRSGKDTVGTYLTCFHGYHKKSFADKLKDSASELFGVDRAIFDSDMLKDAPLAGCSLNMDNEIIKHALASEFPSTPPEFHTPRTLCIMLGAVGRAISPTFWVDRAMADRAQDKNYVITDARFINEIETVKKLGNVTTIRINRFDSLTSQNPSERELDNYAFDFILENKGSIRELYNQVDDIIKELT